MSKIDWIQLTFKRTNITFSSETNMRFAVSHQSHRLVAGLRRGDQTTTIIGRSDAFLFFILHQQISARPRPIFYGGQNKIWQSKAIKKFSETIILTKRQFTLFLAAFWYHGTGIPSLVSRPTRWSLRYWYLDVYVDHLVGGCDPI